MNEIAIIEIDALLKLVDAFRLTGNEIVKLDKAGHQPNEIQGYYEAAQQTLAWRTTYNAQAKQQLEALEELAGLDAVELPPVTLDTPVVNVPIFGIAL